MITLALAGHAGAASFLTEALSSGPWSNPALWSGGQVPANGTPAAGDLWSVTLDNAVTVTNDVTATVDTLRFGENGSLASILGGSTGAVSVAREFDWKRGVLGPAGLANFTVLSGATASLTTSGFKFLRQRLVNEGTMEILETTLAGNADARLTNASGGRITMSGGSKLSVTGLVRNEAGATFASLAAPPGTAGNPPLAVVNQIEWAFDSRVDSTVEIGTTTAFNGGGTHRGHYKIDPQATLQFGFVGTTNTFAPQSLEAGALSIANVGSQVTVAQSSAVLPTIQSYQQTGGTTNFQRDVTITDATLQSGAVLNATNGTARFEGNGAFAGAQLGGTNGMHVLGPGSNTTLTGSNVIDAKVEQRGFVAMNGGDLFFAPNGSWVVDVGGRFVIADKAGVRRSVQQGAGLGVFEVRNGGLVVADLLDAEHDAAMHALHFPVGEFDIVQLSPGEPNLFIVPKVDGPGGAAPQGQGPVERSTPLAIGESGFGARSLSVQQPIEGESTSAGPVSSFAALSVPEPLEAAAILVSRGRFTVTESMVGPFDVRVRKEGSFLAAVQPEGALRLIGNGKAGRSLASDTLEWRGIIDALALDDEESRLTFVSHLGLAEEALLIFDLGARSDSLSVQGDLVLDGTIEVRAGEGFTRGRYRLLEWTGTLDDRGVELVGPDGFGYSLDFDLAGGHLDLVVTAVPEPHTATLALAGLLVLWVRRPSFFRRS